jgi:hypothetical protein
MLPWELCRSETTRITPSPVAIDVCDTMKAMEM